MDLKQDTEEALQRMSKDFLKVVQIATDELETSLKSSEPIAPGPYGTAAKKAAAAQPGFQQSPKPVAAAKGNLPWFKHGIRGFLNKLWYGDHPSNPSWAGQREWVTLESHSKAFILFQPILDEFLNPILEFVTPETKTALDKFKDTINRQAHTFIQHALQKGIELGKKYPNKPDDPDEDAGTPAPLSPAPNNPGPPANSDDFLNPDEIEKLLSPDDSQPNTPAVSPEDAANEISTRLLQTDDAEKLLTLNSSELETFLKQNHASLLGHWNLPIEKLVPLIYRNLSEKRKEAESKAAEEKKNLDSLFEPGNGEVKSPKHLPSDWLTTNGNFKTNSNFSKQEMAKHVMAYLVKNHNVNPLDWEKINKILSTLSSDEGATLWNNFNGSKLAKMMWGGDAKVRAIARRRLADDILKWFGVKVKPQDFVGKRKFGKESGSDWEDWASGVSTTPGAKTTPQNPKPASSETLKSGPKKKVKKEPQLPFNPDDEVDQDALRSLAADTEGLASMESHTMNYYQRGKFIEQLIDRLPITERTEYLKVILANQDDSYIRYRELKKNNSHLRIV